ncbi:MAG: hypothetical protein MUO52_19520, partial [Desulfobacterales bacterium]|nr:hypothetical protein [Desulfobacterales bacterium]
PEIMAKKVVSVQGCDSDFFFKDGLERGVGWLPTRTTYRKMTQKLPSSRAFQEGEEPLSTHLRKKSQLPNFGPLFPGGLEDLR